MGGVDGSCPYCLRGMENLCDAPVLVDAKSGQAHYQTSFYYIGHFSRFVRPGARRISSIGGPESLQSVAFINPDNSIVTVVLNDKNAAVHFVLSVPGSTLACNIPAHAIQTYCWQHSLDLTRSDQTHKD